MKTVQSCGNEGNDCRDLSEADEYATCSNIFSISKEGSLRNRVELHKLNAVVAD